MYFKELGMTGFKSFLYKTTLKFEPGVTGIVGPNGCGKSNVVDAIKWVFGEQSAKSMRGNEMQDVIFNGTEKYEPVNSAEVSFTLSNEDRVLPVDYDEVTISRRLYRDGQSEYLLNKTLVRLADIRDMFMGTGIGTSSYSVVEQGNIDMILSSKPEDRRYIFEEASGITLYKTKKREALLKLERVQENLTRLNDIIIEVEKQISLIERKARKAERYKVRYEELKYLETKSAVRKIRKMNERISFLEKEKKELNEKSENLAYDLEEAGNLLFGLREEHNSAFECLQNTQDEITHLASNIDKNRHMKTLNEERIKELEKYTERLNWEITSASEKKEALGARLESIEVKFLDINRKRRDKEEELISLETHLKTIGENIDKFKHELDFKRSKTLDIISNREEAKNALIRIDADIRNLLGRGKTLDKAIRSARFKKDSFSEQVKTADEKFNAVRKDLEDKKAVFDAFSRGYIEHQQKLSEKSFEGSAGEKRLNEVKLRRVFLENLIARREGASENVKKIMELVESGDARFRGVRGRLSELVNIREDFAESVEAFLGVWSDSIVVDNRATAESLAKFLSEMYMESVNFIIIEDFLKSRTAPSDNDKGLLEKGLQDIAHIFSAEEPYRSILNNLLKNAAVDVYTEDDCLLYAKTTDFNGCIVAKKGMISESGRLRSKNRSKKENIPLFGRREKVDEMLRAENVLVKEIEEINENMEELKECIKNFEAKKEQIESELRGKESEFVDVSSMRAIIRDKFNAENSELLVFETEQEDIDALNLKMESEKRRLTAIVTELEKDNAHLHKAIEEAREVIREDTCKREEVFLRGSDVKSELSALRKEEENLKENIEREKAVYESLERRACEESLRIKENTDRIKSLTLEIEELDRAIRENQKAHEEKEKEIIDRKKRKDALLEQISVKSQNIKEKEKELEKYRNTSRDMDVEFKEFEYKKCALVEKMSDSYKVNVTACDITINENEDWEEAARRVDELKMQLEKIGEVSLEAVDEHKELEERFNFLCKQRTDLSESRESLLSAISKINRTTRKMFMETFENVKKEFNNYFRMLFNGGKAEIILEDEMDALECGIDIVVRPPGKKIHNIMQLSGGEKALSAIALIFAIFKVNPSPFCILDEIDAPLDESNITRFCRILQDFTKSSQFIIVTHNRTTIQLADILYGITMEEKGISKVVSVKLTEEAKPVEKSAEEDFAESSV